MFCKYFAEIGPKFAEWIPVSEKSYNHYIKRPISNQSFFMPPVDLIVITPLNLYNIQRPNRFGKLHFCMTFIIQNTGKIQLL